MGFERFSAQEHLREPVSRFLEACAIVDSGSVDFVNSLIFTLANCKEEEWPLYPAVYIIQEVRTLASIAPGLPALSLAAGCRSFDPPTIVKRVGTLAAAGWGIYVVLGSETVLDYGVFRTQATSFARSAEDSIGTDGTEDGPLVILARSSGTSTVHLRSSRGCALLVDLSAPESSRQPTLQHLQQLSDAVAETIQDEEKEDFSAYLSRYLDAVLPSSHGTLIAVLDRAAHGRREESLLDGIWLPEPVSLAAALADARRSLEASKLATLQSYEALLSGMLRSDGVVIFDNHGSVLGYRVFISPNPDEHPALPTSGGSRRRTFDLLTGRLGTSLRAVFMRSQDGVTACERI